MRPPRAGIERVLRVSGGELAILRRSQGLSQADLAELTGLHRNTITNIERGVKDASVLAMSLVQLHLRAGGVFVEREGFYPSPHPAGSAAYPYPELLIAPPAMVSAMGDRVRRRRLDLGLSLHALASACGVHVNTIWNFERGLVAPSVSTTYLVYSNLQVRWIGGSKEGLVLTGP